MENTSTLTPYQRATRKWPSSWKNTTTVSTNRNGISVPSTPEPSMLIPDKKIETHQPGPRVPSPTAIF